MMLSISNGWSPCINIEVLCVICCRRLAISLIGASLLGLVALLHYSGWLDRQPDQTRPGPPQTLSPSLFPLFVRPHTQPQMQFVPFYLAGSCSVCNSSLLSPSCGPNTIADLPFRGKGQSQRLAKHKQITVLWWLGVMGPCLASVD